MSIQLIPKAAFLHCSSFLSLEERAQIQSVNKLIRSYLAEIVPIQRHQQLLEAVEHTPSLAHCMTFLSREELQHAAATHSMWKMAAEVASYALRKKVHVNIAFFRKID